MSESFQTFGSEQQIESQFPLGFFIIIIISFSVFQQLAKLQDELENNCKMNWRPEYPMMIEEYSLENNKIPGLPLGIFILFFCFPC